MRTRDSIEGSIICIGGTLPAFTADAYVVELRYDNHGIRRSQTSALVAPMLPEINQTTAITQYSPEHYAITRHQSPSAPSPVRRFPRLFAAVSILIISLGAFAAIWIQKLSHELAAQRRVAESARGRLVVTQEPRDVSADTVSALAASLRQAADKAERSTAVTKLHNDALLAASSGAVDSNGIAQLTAYVARLRSVPNSLDTLAAMGGMLAARDLPAQAAICFSAVLDADGCPRAQRLLALAGLADTAVRQAKLADADTLYRELIDLERADHELSPRALQHLAEFIKIKIRRDMEEDANEAVSGMFSRLTGDRAKSLAPAFVRQTLLGLTDFAVDHAHPAVAIRLLDRALLLKDASSSAAAAAPFRQMLLTLHAQNGSELEARRLMKKLLKQQTKELGNDPEVANTAMQVAALDEQLGDLYSAERTLKAALNIRERAYGNDHPDVADTAYALARVYERQGRRSESEALLGLVKGIWARKRSADSTRDAMDHVGDESER